VVFTYIAGLFISKSIAGKYFLGIADRTVALDPSSCTKFDCRGFVDYNQAKKDWRLKGDDRACFLSNPLFGYYNTCGNGKLGLSWETLKSKPSSTYRVLVVGGSQANINTPYIEKALKSKIKGHDRYTNIEVFGAAIGGGKQPMQFKQLRL